MTILLEFPVVILASRLAQDWASIPPKSKIDSRHRNRLPRPREVQGDGKGCDGFLNESSFLNTTRKLIPLSLACYHLFTLPTTLALATCTEYVRRWKRCYLLEFQVFLAELITVLQDMLGNEQDLKFHLVPPCCHCRIIS